MCSYILAKTRSVASCLYHTVGILLLSCVHTNTNTHPHSRVFADPQESTHYLTKFPVVSFDQFINHQVSQHFVYHVHVCASACMPMSTVYCPPLCKHQQKFFLPITVFPPGNMCALSTGKILSNLHTHENMHISKVSKASDKHSSE